MKMRSAAIVFALLAVLGLFAVVPTAEAQAARKVYRIGFLSLATGPGLTTRSFLEALRELGFVEGQNFVMEYRWAALKNERLPELASDLVRAKVDVIVTSGTPATIAAQRATQTIPIVFASMGNPVERGVVASLAHPGRNATGLAQPGVDSRVLQLLKDMAPKVSRVAFFYDPAVWATQPLEVQQARLNAAVKPFGMTVQWVPIRDAGDVERAFTQLGKETDGLLLANETSVAVAQKQICGLALQRKLPAVGRQGGQADAGCLMGAGSNLPDMYRRAAILVDKILKGTKPADLPVELPEKFDLVVNLITAKALGLTVAPALLAQATRTVSVAKAQQTGRVYKIGFLSLADRSFGGNPILTSALRDRGYESGRNLLWISRFAAGKTERLPDLAADLIGLKVDLILALGASEAVATIKATGTMPIVFISPTPVELGLVRSLARPGGNATGMSVEDPEFVGKLLELFKQILPRFSRGAVLWDPDGLGNRSYEKVMRDAGQTLKVEMQFLSVRTLPELESAFVTMVKERHNAMIFPSDPIFVLNQKRIVDFAIKNRIAIVSDDRHIVENGGLLSYGPNFDELSRGLAAYIDKILKGAKPADLPVEQPRKFDLVINRKTAKALGLTIPQLVLLQATEVIE